MVLGTAGVLGWCALMREEPVEEGKGVEVRRVWLRRRGYGVRELNNVRSPLEESPRNRSSQLRRGQCSWDREPCVDAAYPCPQGMVPKAWRSEVLMRRQSTRPGTWVDRSEGLLRGWKTAGDEEPSFLDAGRGCSIRCCVLHIPPPPHPTPALTFPRMPMDSSRSISYFAWACACPVCGAVQKW